MADQNSKRQPLLVDKFIAQKYDRHTAEMVPKDFWETTRANCLLAKRFVFDKDATTYCADMIRRAPRIIADAQEFAIPPFDRLYIEIDFTTWYRTITGREPDWFADTRAGYLIVNGEVRCIAESKEGFGISPIVYHLNKPFSVREEIEICEKIGTSRAQLDLFFWGESALAFTTLKCVKLQDGKRTHEVTIDDEWQKEGLRSLRANHSFSINFAGKEFASHNLWDAFHKGSAGDMRNIIGMLLFMNRTSKTRYEKDVEHQPGRWIGNRQATFLKHRVISFSVNPTPRLMKLVAGEGIRRRLHDVRGHFCHNEEARTNHHDHEWQESVETDLQWFCACGGKRWWKKQHMRGHSDKGIVTSEYKVTE